MGLNGLQDVSLEWCSPVLHRAPFAGEGTVGSSSRSKNGDREARLYLGSMEARKSQSTTLSAALSNHKLDIIAAAAQECLRYPRKSSVCLSDESARTIAL